MQIFPKEILDNTIQVYVPKNRTKSKIIYGLILLVLVSAIISLPFIKVKIYSSSRGIIKPNRERIAITSINSGKVLFSALEKDKYVKKGEILLVIENNVLDEQISLVSFEEENSSKEIDDLAYLLNSDRIKIQSIQSPKYKREYIHYKERFNEHATRIAKLKIDFDRNRKLLEKEVIAKADFEDIQLDYKLALNSFNQFKKQQVNTWQATLTELEINLEATKSQRLQYEQNKNEYTIKAPISGTLMNLIGIEKGSIVASGITLSEISPDSDLLAECYVGPMDIGLLQREKPINFQIDAYNYNQWGLATGKIISVAEDVEILNDSPIFKVQCKINEDYLMLKNGAKGTIGKGMTFNARFELTERTLYQLLYDKIDDWLNPGTQNEVASIE